MKKYLTFIFRRVSDTNYLLWTLFFFQTHFQNHLFFPKQPSLPHVAPCRLPKCISSDLSRYTGENMCSRTGARRDRRSAMMFHYIDYADTAVRTRNRQSEGNRESEREGGRKGARKTESRRQTNTDRKRGRRRRRTQKNGASVSMRGGT